MADRELLDAFATELAEIGQQFAQTLKVLTDATATPAQLHDAEDEYSSYLRRVASAADMIGLVGIRGLASFLISNVEELAKLDNQKRSDPAHLRLFEVWPTLLSAYIQDTEATQPVSALMQHLQDSHWPHVIDEESAFEIAEQLMGIELDEGTPTEEQEPKKTEAATGDSVEVAFDEDVDPQLIDIFLQETPIHVAKLSALFQLWSTDEIDAMEIIQAQRIAHTVKGSANITGVKGIANLTHCMEDILETLADLKQLPPADLCQTLIETTDCLEQMLEMLSGIGELPPESILLLQRLMDWRQKIQSQSDLISPVLPQIESQNQTTQNDLLEDLEEEPQFQDPDADTLPVPAAVEPQVAAGNITPSLRVPTSTIDELLRFAGEVALSAVQMQGFHQRTLARIYALNTQNALLNQRLEALQELVEVRSVPATKHRLQVIGAPDKEFDPLEFDEYNELHSATNMLVESVTDSLEIANQLESDIARFGELLIQQDGISKELNDTALSARMVPIETIVPRLHRTVRQTCRATDKNVKLNVHGSDVQIDSEVLTHITDSLMHMLRNAIDHGIESPMEREEVGKPPGGEIDLTFSREGNDILIRCSDDGMGFDYVQIRTSAEAKGLLEPGMDASNEELARLTMLPGITTKTDTTEISGRGIGMSVVHESILDQRGTIDIASQPGAGTTISIRLPLTLISMHVLTVRTGNSIFAVPSSNLEQVLTTTLEDFDKSADVWQYQFEDAAYNVRTLSSLVGDTALDIEAVNRESIPLLLVRSETENAAIIFDEPLDSGYLVMKQLGVYMPRIRGVIGASILADGRVAPVLDLRELLRDVDSGSNLFSLQPQTALNDPISIPSVLIVDDSISARQSLSQVITDAGFEARTAIDGLDAIDVIDEKRPAAVLVDLEMPRMNGLELASHLKTNPDTKDLPLLMITSRSTDKHRQQAISAGVDHFITKPFSNDELVQILREMVAVR